jgi:ribosomal protein S13
VEAARLCSNPSARPAFARLLTFVTDSSEMSNTHLAVTWENAVGHRSQTQRRLPASESEALCAAYRNGRTIRALSAQFGIHRTTVTAILERAGIDRRIRTISDEEVERATELYDEGFSTAIIGNRLGFSAETVRSHLMRNGVKIRPRRGWSS